MKTQLLLALISMKLMGTLILTTTTLIGTPVVCMEKDSDSDEKAGDKKALSPFLKLRTHPRDFTWADMTKVMKSVSFDKIDPKSKTKDFQHRLENEDYYFTIKSKSSLMSLFDKFTDLTYRLALHKGPTLVMLDTQLTYEIIVEGSGYEKKIADFMISYVHKNMVSIATHVPFIKTIQRKSTRKAHKKFLERASSKLELLSTERKDLIQRTKKSEQNAHEAMQHIDSFYANLGSPKQADTQETQSSSESSSSFSSNAHSAPTRTRSRILGRVRARSEVEKIERNEQKEKETHETIDTNFVSSRATPRRLSRSIAKTEHSSSNEKASTSGSSVDSSFDGMDDSPEGTDNSDSNSFE